MTTTSTQPRFCYGYQDAATGTCSHGNRGAHTTESTCARVIGTGRREHDCTRPITSTVEVCRLCATQTPHRGCEFVTLNVCSQHSQQRGGGRWNVNA